MAYSPAVCVSLSPLFRCFLYDQLETFRGMLNPLAQLLAITTYLSSSLSVSCFCFQLLGPQGVCHLIATHFYQARLLACSIKKKLFLDEIRHFFGFIEP